MRQPLAIAQDGSFVDEVSKRSISLLDFLAFFLYLKYLGRQAGMRLPPHTLHCMVAASPCRLGFSPEVWGGGVFSRFGTSHSKVVLRALMMHVQFFSPS